ncbi:hypothetical protein BSZ05_13705 [Vibrio mediterranei]|uniref:DUF3131 domain-containing protein n=1 Tax=Vibrio mediterranei TaxID=689 RepID=A0AAN1KPI2_9VIBR|nr:DUF3131 domain-containing protein [Vibrio mediterranei]ASI91485.1 hypothetical protein BSZ05_13705 [Vibrio mediterranei]
MQKLMPVLGLYTAFIPVLTFASDKTVAPSFYGGRGFSQGDTPETPSAIEYQRRALAPPIIVETIIDVPSTVKLNRPPLSATNSSQTVELDLSRLTRNDWLLAKKSMYYFDLNYHPETGFWDSVQGYHHTTMWDIASGISATLASYELNLISREEVRDKLSLTLDTLATIALYQNTLPNREYSTKHGKPSGSYSDTKSNGNGWSALDIGRLLIWLRITEKMLPELASKVAIIEKNWKLASAVHKGTLYGTKLYKNKEYYRQEGRLGYLQYAAQGFELFGYNLAQSFTKQHVEKVSVDGMSVYVDNRNVPYFTTDPYVLTAIEIGAKNVWWNQLDQLYQLHKKRSKQLGQPQVFAEDAMSKSPWFAYNNIYYYGKPWLSVSPGGKPIENPQTFSSKIGFGLSVLYTDDFSQQLYNTVVKTSLSSRSIPTGRYKNGGTNTAYNINTNSLVLTALWYKALGNHALYPYALEQSNSAK